MKGKFFQNETKLFSGTPRSAEEGAGNRKKKAAEV